MSASYKVRYVKHSSRGAGPILVPDFLPSALHKDGSTPDPSPALSERRDALDDGNGFAALYPFVEDLLQTGTTDLHDQVLRRVECLLLTRVLQQTQGNQLQAAKILGITRGSLRTKLRDLGIAITRGVSSSDGNED